MAMKAAELAKYIITKCTQDGYPVSNLQLQKILYYIQVAFLQELHCLCFDDPIEAWQFGPVIREVYYIYCYFGSIPIEREYECIALDTTAKAIIDRIIEEKRDLPPWALVTATHEPGKAWSRAYKKGSYSRISVKDMQLYG